MPRLTAKLSKAVQNGDLAELNKLMNMDGFSFSHCQKGGYGLLTTAISSRRTEVAKLLLQNGVKVNNKTEGANTALHLACQNGYAVLVEMLIDKKALVDPLNRDEKTPLHIAIEKGDKNIVQLLLNGGADRGLRNGHGMRLLHIACRSGCVEIVELLLSCRAKEQYTNPQSLYQALQLACLRNSKEIVVSLLNAGANPNVITEQHATDLEGPSYLDSPPLFLACKERHKGIMELLVKHGAEVNCSGDRVGYKPLHLASENGLEEIVSLLLNNGADPNAKAVNNITPLHLAAKRGSLKIVKLLLSTTACVNAQNSTGSTPLHLALENSHEYVVDYLLNHGADPNAKTEENITPLHLAAKKGYVRFVEQLLTNTVNVNLQTCKGFTPLHYACEYGYRYTEIVSLLLQNGADPIVEAEDKITPLHLAAKTGRSEVVKELLSCITNVNGQTLKGYTPLHFASESGNVDVVGLLLHNGADVNIKADDAITPLHLAAKKTCTGIVELLLNSNANVDARTVKGATPLLLASEHWSVETVKILLERGANVDSKDESNNSPLLLAVETGYSSVISCILQYKPHVNDRINNSILRSIKNYNDTNVAVKYMIEQGFTIDEEDVNDDNLLPAALQKGYTKIVKCILDCGANPNDEKYGLSPLHDAVQMGHEEIIKLLLVAGCDVNAKHRMGNTPIWYARNWDRDESKCLDITRLLLAHGADLKKEPRLLLEAVSKKLIEVCQILIENGADTNALDEYGCTPLHLAASSKGCRYNYSFGHEESECNRTARRKITELLLNNGANVNFKMARDGFTPLHVATIDGSKEIASILLDFGADINACAKNGSTPLHLACEQEKEEMVKMLLSRKANVDSIQNDGLTPLHLAVSRRFVQTVKILLEFNASVDAVGKDGSTALHRAQSAQVVQILLDFGANINARVSSKSRETPLHCAVKEGHSEIVLVLVENGCDINLENSKGRTALNKSIFTTKTYNRGRKFDNGQSFYDHICCDVKNGFISPNRRIAKTFKYHIVRLQAAGLPVSDNFLLNLKDNLSDFKHECEEEVDKMKKMKLCCHLMLHDILVNHKNAGYVSSKSVIQALECFDSITFPIYGNLIVNTFRNNKRRNELCNSAQLWLEILLRTSNILNKHKSPTLPVELLNEIVSYLSVKELKILIFCGEGLKQQLCV